MSELKPCPFCGGEVVIKSHNKPQFGCKKPLCMGYKFRIFDDSMPQAIKAFNTRNNEALKQELIEAVNKLPPSYHRSLVQIEHVIEAINKVMG